MMPKGSALGISLIATGWFSQPCAPAQTPKASTDRRRCNYSPAPPFKAVLSSGPVSAPFLSAMRELLKASTNSDLRLPNITTMDILGDSYPSAESLPVSGSCRRMIQNARPGESTTPAMEANLPPSVGTSVGGYRPRRVVGALRVTSRSMKERKYET